MLGWPCSRHISLTLSALLGFVLFLLLALSRNSTTYHGLLKSPTRTLGFHYILPTTGTNADACKLLLSSAVTGYPDPVLVGWEGRGRWNGSQSHLFKISETLFYLEALQEEQDDDLVLVLDAFDIWMQLPPDTLIRRYFQAIERGNQRLKDGNLFGHHSFGGVSIRNTILLGADKACWPLDGVKMRCDFAPISSLSSTVFGPNTDAEEVTLRPRYLNSGTIMGPAKDLRDYFRAALETVEAEWNNMFEHRDSDQHYFGIVWGQQEEARARLRDGGTDVQGEITRREFHVLMDYESDAFQINNMYAQWVTWMAFNHSTDVSSSAVYHPGRLDRLRLTEDVLSLRGPYSAADFLPPEIDRPFPVHKTWKDVLLGTNTITGQAFPLYHVTGNKDYRDLWWPRMWFHPYSELLLKAARKQHLDHLKNWGQRVLAEIQGIKYVNVEANAGDTSQSERASDALNDKGGVWNDVGQFLHWDALCGDHEAEVFGPWEEYK